jgi:NAD(P)-dependent dehydrogenase (short-subunit alcohol dehydrogenase family)
MRLKGKTAIITAAGTEIGRAGVRRFLEEGAMVAAAGIDEAALNETVRAGRQISSRIIGVPVDVANEHSVQYLVEKTIACFGAVNVLINNASLVHPAKLHEIGLEDWEKVFSVNATGVFFACKYALPVMMARKEGVIINTALFEGEGMDAPASYVSKGAIPALTRSIAIDYAPYNIRANCICSRIFVTGVSHTAVKEQKARSAGLPPDYAGTPEGIADALVFLASDESAFMTGASLDL